MNREKWEKWRKKYWPPRKDQLLILALLGLLLAVIAVPVQKNDGEASDAAVLPAETEETREDYESRLESRLEEMLSQVEGIGKVRVMLTFADSGQKQVEKDVNVTENSTQEETVYEDQGSSERTPYVSSETPPQVEGVLVIAEGGDDGDVKADIIEAAQALFGIEAHKIKIMKYGGD
ncbi:MAG: stage III sporulation protein AG [Lachnospiraceae bacterium]|nr:stage III sporulation protein AG [Lachnospiraceae bacterium]